MELKPLDGSKLIEKVAEWMGRMAERGMRARAIDHTAARQSQQRGVRIIRMGEQAR